MGINMGHFFEELNIGNFFENMDSVFFLFFFFLFRFFSIDVRFQSKLFLKNDILNLKSAVLAENDIF